MALVNSAFTVNVTPGAMPPIVHVSEYDVGRTYTVTINGENGSAFNIPNGTTATIEGTLNGSVGFTQSATISNNQVSFALSESMTAYSGKAWCKIKLTLNDEPIQTCAFVLSVDRAGLKAETVIGADGFDTIIQDAVDNYLEDHPIAIDPTLTISGAAADAKVTGDKFSDLKSALGEYVQHFTMSTQYLATFYCENTGAFYFKLLEHPTATYSGVCIYGMTGTTETGIVTTPIPLREFYWSGISSSYDKIKITVGFGSQVSGNVSVICAPNGGDNVSAQTVENTVSIKDLIRSVDKNRTGDLYRDIPFITGKNITSDFTKCTVDTYKDILNTSSVGSVSNTAIRIRDDDGNLFANIYFVIPSRLDTGSATMCWTFDKNGNPLGNIAGNALNNGFASNVYYIVLVNYNNDSVVSAIYDSSKEYTFEVAPSGKPFSSFSDCVKRTNHIPYAKKIKVYSGEYNIYTEIGGDTFANSIASGTNWREVSVVVEDNTRVVGIGRVVLKFEPENINSTAVQLLSPLNISGNVTIKNIQIVCKNCRYGIHIEGSALDKYNNSVCTLKNVIVTRNIGKDESGYNGPALGVGMNARSKLIFESCKIDAKGGWAGLYFHENTTTLELSPQLEIKNSIFEVASGYGLALSASANQTTMIDTFIEGSYIDTVRKMTGGSSVFNDAYAIVMLNCNMPTFSASDLMQNEVAVKHYNTIS